MINKILLMLKKIIIYIIQSIIVTSIIPITVAVITTILFPDCKFSTVQLSWIFFCIWMILNYIKTDKKGGDY